MALPACRWPRVHRNAFQKVSTALDLRTLLRFCANCINSLFSSTPKPRVQSIIELNVLCYHHSPSKTTKNPLDTPAILQSEKLFYDQLSTLRHPIKHAKFPRNPRIGWRRPPFRASKRPPLNAQPTYNEQPTPVCAQSAKFCPLAPPDQRATNYEPRTTIPPTA